MSFLKSKSEENLKAADYLLQEKMYTSSVHCSYYACIQLMLHILYHKDNMNDDDVKNKTDEEKVGTHKWLINTFIMKLKSSSNQKARTYERTFRTRINQLKSVRINSDYLNREIPLTTSSDSYQYSQDIIQNLTNFFL